MGFALIAWINSTMFEHIFEKYMPKEDHSHDGEVKPILEDINMDGSLKEGASGETEKAITELKKSSDDEWKNAASSVWSHDGGSGAARRCRFLFRPVWENKKSFYKKGGGQVIIWSLPEYYEKNL